MRSSWFRLLLVAAMAAMVSFQFGCGNETSDTATSADAGAGVTTAATATETPLPFTAPDAAQTVPEEQPSPYGAGTTGTQAVGTLIDGLQLCDIRWSDHGSYFRIVFEMGTPDGELVLQVPHADASMSPDHKQVRVILGGIRSIGAAGNVTANNLEVGDPLVKTIKRLPESDDQALVYSIELAAPATYSLAGIGAPGRIVIDIIKS